jgi:NADPH-dependent FMN reductase
MPHILVIQGSTRDGPFSDKVVNWVRRGLDSRPDVTVELADLRDHRLPFFDQGIPPSRTPREYPSGEVARFAQAVDRADGLPTRSDIRGQRPHGCRIIADHNAGARIRHPWAPFPPADVGSW